MRALVPGHQLTSISSYRSFSPAQLVKCAYGRKPCFSKARITGMASSKRTLVPIANGSEEMEAVIIIDCLRRAGIEVDVASVEDSTQITASRQVTLVADKLVSECTNEIYDCIALPGGMPGAERLRECEELREMLKEQEDSGRICAAICAAPAVVLESQGLLKNVPATCHPAFFDQLPEKTRSSDRVVVSGHIITSRGPGTAFEFALTLIENMLGAEKRSEVAGPMVTMEAAQ